RGRVRRRRRRGRRGGADHRINRTDAGDRVLGEGERHGDGADKFAVDIDRATAHSLHDAGMLERTAGEASENERFFGANVVEHAENFYLKLLDLASGEDRPSDAAHAGFEVFDREKGCLGGQHGGERERRRYNQASHHSIVAGEGVRSQKTEINNQKARSYIADWKGITCGSKIWETHLASRLLLG